MIPFLINVLGWNLFLYINFGSSDLVIAASQGVSHNAWAEHADWGGSVDPSLNFGPIYMFAEQSIDPMRPFGFKVSNDADYRSFEFPWLALCVVFFGLGLYRRKGTAVCCCAECGYDLRESGEKCPECGADNPPLKPTPTRMASHIE